MRNIEVGKIIELTKDNYTNKFEITKIKGVGASCIAYEVSYYENDSIPHLGILKEYCPFFLEREDKPIRDEYNIIIPDEQLPVFKRGLEEFISTYKKINDYIYSHPQATNAHPTQLGIYYANNTAYTLVASDYGKTYDIIPLSNIVNEIKRTLAITKAVEMYHQAGFLHLDIKPQNILILDEINDMIKLFDYDSLISIDKVKEGYHVPDTGLFYVPEIQSRNFRRIGIHTDIFEIASTLYFKLFDKVPAREQMTSDYKYNFDDVKLFNGVSPKAIYEIEQLFKHTLQISPIQRYTNTSDFKNQLEKIISLLDSQKPYLINLPKWQPSVYSLGRDQELNDIHNLLNTNGYVMIKAMGGLGKSELAKMYANQYGDDYHTVQFCKYSGSLKALVSSISINGVIDSDYENIDKLAKAKNDVLHNCDNHTLLIIDNFNVTYDEYLRDFIPADNSGFKVIFTTRCEPAQDYLLDKVYELTTLPESACKQLFYLHSGLSETVEENLQVERLLEIIECNTLVLVLIAKSIRLTKNTLEEVIDQLKKSRMDNISGDVFHEYDYSSIEGNNYNKVFAHLNTIFSISRLTGIQKELLLCLSLISNIGIETEEFIKDCGNENFTKEAITELVAFGWIEEEKVDWISLHPIVSDLVFANEKINRGKSYDDLSYSIINQCNTDGTEHIDILNVAFSYLFHLDKRLGTETEFRSIDVKLYLAKLYFNLYMPKEANQKLTEAEEIVSHSFRYKPRLCELYWLKGEIENEFGNPEKAIEQYNTALTYCKKTVNCYYDEHLNSIIGIAECYVKLHDYKQAYKYYTDAYNYVYKDSLKEKLNSKLFVTDNYGTKDLFHYIPSICEGIIAVCRELQLQTEIEKYQKIKSEFQIQDNDFQIAADEAQKLFQKGDIKGGTRIFFEALENAKVEYGEDSPLYKKVESDLKPLLVMSIADDESISIRPIVEGVEYTKEKYGEYSIEYLDYIDTILNVLPEIGELEFAKGLALECKELALKTLSKNSYLYQSFNLHLVNINQLLGDTLQAKESLNDVDYSFFEAKSELETLVKRIGLALYNYGEYDVAIKIADDVYHLEGVETSSQFMSCLILALVYVDNKDFNKAKTFFKSGRSIIEKFNNGFLKDEYLYMYYYGLAKYYSELNDEEKATDVLQEYINRVETQNGYTISLLKCRALCERSIHFRYIQKYQDAYENVKQAVQLLNNSNSLNGDLIERVVFGNYAICCMYCQHFDEAYDYIEKYMALFTDEQKTMDKDYLTAIVFFIDALIVSHDKSFYYFIEEAEKVVEKGNFNNDFENAMLKNYIGVVLCDYEEKYGLAKNYCEEAKEILDRLNMQDNKLYEQILSNIEYADKKNWDSLLKGLADAYGDNNE